MAACRGCGGTGDLWDVEAGKWASPREDCDTCLGLGRTGEDSEVVVWQPEVNDLVQVTFQAQYRSRGATKHILVADCVIDGRPEKLIITIPLDASIRKLDANGLLDYCDEMCRQGSKDKPPHELPHA